MLSENKMAAFNIASTAIVASINFLTIPIFTRMLDTSGYGLVNIYVAWVQICTMIVGLQSQGSIGSAKANLADDEQSSYQLSVLVMSVFPFAGVMLGCCVFAAPLSNWLAMPAPLVICMPLQSFGAFLVSFFSMRFIFEKEAQKNLMISVGLCIASTALSIFLIVFAFPSADAFFGRVLGLMIPNLFIGLLLLAILIVRRGKSSIKVKYWRFCLVLSLPLVLHGLSQVLLSQTGKIAIQQMWDDSLAGIYSIAVVVVGLMSAIYNALNNAFVPFMYDDLAGKTTELVKRSHFTNYLTLFTEGSCAFVLLSPEILKVMSPESYWAAIDVLPLLVIGQYCVFLYSFPVNYEFYKMRTASVAVGTVLAAFLCVLLSFSLTSHLGMHGAAIATMIAYLALFLFHFCIARYRLGDRNYPARSLFGGLALVVVVAIGCYSLMDYVFARWAIGVCLLVAALFRIWRNKTIF